MNVVLIILILLILLGATGTAVYLSTHMDRNIKTLLWLAGHSPTGFRFHHPARR
jgi:hypothetical protein